MPKFDPPLEITEEQRAAAMPWAMLQLRFMWGVLVSYGLMLGYLVYTAVCSQTNWYLIAIWYVANSTILTGSACYCSYELSRIADDDIRLFRLQDWWWMFLRPFLVVAVAYAVCVRWLFIAA